MKTPISPIVRPVLFLLLLGTLPTGCKKDSDPAAQSSCRVTARKNEAGTTQTAWDYNADGYPTKITNSGGSRDEYTYNADGYLTTITVYNSSGTTSGSFSSEYANGRIARRARKVASGATYATDTYDYDGSGALTRVVDSYPGVSTQTYTFTNGRQTGYVYRSAAGAESQVYTFEDGRIKRYTSGTSQSNYEYDAQGRRTRFESLSSGRVTGYTVYEYTDGKGYPDAVPLNKGVPEVLRYGYNFDGDNLGLPAKITGYTTPTSGSTYKSYEYTYTYVKNGSGFPTESSYVYREFNTSGSTTYTSARKDTYTYQNCP